MTLGAMGGGVRPYLARQDDDINDDSSDYDYDHDHEYDDEYDDECGCRDDDEDDAHGETAD